MVDIQQFGSAISLPCGWDGLAPSYFQQREFLTFAERYNPCRQRYYALFEDGTLRAGVIVYTLRLNLFTFLRIPSPVTMHIVSVPVGTATAGYFGEPSRRQELFHHVSRQERGILLTLNVDPADDLPAGARCRMIPTILFDNRFRDWEDYLSSVRWPYRRRLHQIEACASRLVRVRSGCSDFSERHYELYRQVRSHASATLEYLTLEFFRNLPERFALSSYYHDGVLVSWTITVHDGTMFMYFFGGMEYATLKETHSYVIGLANIVRDCIDQRHPLLDLGQTADNPKLRFGGRPQPKDMYLNHHLPAVRVLFRAFRSLIGYHGRIPSFHVFKPASVAS